MADSRQKFVDAAPYGIYGKSGLVTTAMANTTINEWKATVADMQKRQMELKVGDWGAGCPWPAPTRHGRSGR